MLVDFILFQISFLLASIIRHGFAEPFPNSMYTDAMLIIAGADICTGFLFLSYKGILRRGYWKELKAAVQHTVIVVAVLVLYIYMGKKSDYISRTVIVLFPVISLILIYIGRLLLKAYLKRHRSTASGKRSIVLICGEENSSPRRLIPIHSSL